MPYNGAGVFNRVYNWVQDKANGIFVTASRMDTEMDGMATGLSTALTKDGQSTPTADLTMGGFKITNLAIGVAAADAVRVSQVAALAGGGVFFNAGNSGSAITIDWNNGILQSVTLTGNCTITLGNGVAVGWYTLSLAQDATGGRSVAWAGAGYNAGTWISNAAAPVINRIASSITIIYLLWNGTNWGQMKLGSLATKPVYTARASRSLTNQTTTAGVTTKVDWDTVDIDPYSEWDITTNNRFTPNNTGLYLITLSILGKNASTAALDTFIYIGGGSVEAFEKTVLANANDTFKSSWVAALSPTLYVEAFFASTTGAGTIAASSLATYMAVTRLGDAE